MLRQSSSGFPSSSVQSLRSASGSTRPIDPLEPGLWEPHRVSYSAQHRCGDVSIRPTGASPSRVRTNQRLRSQPAHVPAIDIYNPASGQLGSWGFASYFSRSWRWALPPKVVRGQPVCSAECPAVLSTRSRLGCHGRSLTFNSVCPKCQAISTIRRQDSPQGTGFCLQCSSHLDPKTAGAWTTDQPGVDRCPSRSNRAHPFALVRRLCIRVPRPHRRGHASGLAERRGRAGRAARD